MPALEALLGRTLVLVAHPDDECITCGGLLQRVREPIVAYATNGAPDDEYFWARHGSRQKYAAIREREAREALGKIGIVQIEFFAPQANSPEEVPVELKDQQLFRNLPQAMALLEKTIRKHHPQALLTLAYEGGHPDHDSCSFLGCMAGTELGIPVWEMPLYHRLHGQQFFQQFVEEEGETMVLEISGEELERKLQMIACYKSQFDALPSFDSRRERFRPQRKYDYSKPPHKGKVNYEVWQWKMTGPEVAEEFSRYLAEWKPRSIGTRC